MVISPGDRFGRLEVRSLPVRMKRSMKFYECLCDCGNRAWKRHDHLAEGKVRSCGCGMVKHGLSRKGDRSDTYQIWANMKYRCSCEKDKAFKNYGGRGIRVCERWMNYENFHADMGDRPTTKHSLDRIDVNGNYEPRNCRWATSREQCRNKRNNVLNESLAAGLRCLLAAGMERRRLSEVYGISRSTIAGLRHCWK